MPEVAILSDKRFNNVFFVFDNIHQQFQFMTDRMGLIPLPLDDKVINRPIEKKSSKDGARVTFDSTIVNDGVLVDEDDVPVFYEYGGNFGSTLEETGIGTSAGRLEDWDPSASTYINLYDDKNYVGTSFDCFGNGSSVILSPGYGNSQFKGISNLGNYNFNNKTTSYKISNPNTRAIIVIFFEHTNYGGKSITNNIDIRQGSTYPVVGDNDLDNNKLNPGCQIFCKYWNNRISSVAYGHLEHADRFKEFYGDNQAGSVVSEIVNIKFESLTGVSLLAYPEPIYNTYVKTGLLKTSGTGWNAGAVGDDTGDELSPGDNGLIEFRINSMNDDIMFGFTLNKNPSAYWDHIDYNLYVSDYRNNTINIFSNTVHKYIYSGSYEVGDYVSIQRISDNVYFFHNSNFIISLPGDLNDRLYFDCSLWNNGAEIQEAIHLGTLVNNTFSPYWAY